MNFGKINNCIFFGGGLLLCRLTQFLQELKQPIIVVTSRRHAEELVGQKETLEQFFKRKRISYFISDDVNKDSSVLKKITSRTLGISVGAAWIFKKSFIDKFSGKLVNLHGSRLPRDRGGGGFSWRILRNDRLGCSLIHQIEPRIDAGSVLTVEEYLFPTACRIPIDFEQYKNERYAQLFKQFFKNIQNNKEFIPLNQTEYLSTYWPRLNTAIHSFIDWSWDVTNIERFICAFDDPYGGACTFLKKNLVQLKKCTVYTDDGIFHPFQAGLIYRIFAGKIFIAVENGSLIVEEVLQKDKRLDNNSFSVGDRFYTPRSYLDKALETKIIYTPEK